ncbi:MAG: hypothetical protein AUJ49_09430 [Desulfovibrionaceae bacterium CG1_02_65_16]|nr:MAG: hypothetical protein AUJ49_09430 [Desulfovibrionaceae bacterium CG1_02_65_16]
MTPTPLLDQVTMLVPTRNRQGYLRNILEMYKDAGLKIIVADTSPAPLPGVEAYSNVRYTHFVEKPFIDVLRFLLESASTEYIVMRAENRHITVNGIARCMALLAERPDCALAHGAHVWVRQKRGRLESWPCYDGGGQTGFGGLPGLMQETAEERLLAAFDPMVSLYYAVERRQNILDVLAQAGGIENLNAFEVLLTAIKAINGKCARVPVLFCAVQERASALKGARNLYDGFDTVATAPAYAEQYARVVNGIACHLRQKTGLDAARAEALTRESLRRFLARLGGKRPETGWQRLRRKAGRFAGSALRLAGVPDAAAARRMNAYLAGLENGKRDYEALLAIIRRGYSEGW